MGLLLPFVQNRIVRPTSFLLSPLQSRQANLLVSLYATTPQVKRYSASAFSITKRSTNPSKRNYPTGQARYFSTLSQPPELKEAIEKMEKAYAELLQGNRQWVEEVKSRDPTLFSRLEKGQSPQTLWIGCSDSRVPATTITNMDPGQIFVHRNIANTVVHTDVNLLSVLQFAVDVIQVKHIIVCGHYGCGGVIAAMTNNQYGLVDNWLRNIKDEYMLYRDELEKITDYKARAERMTELHVIEGVYTIGRTSILKNAWERRKEGLVFPYLHGWVYSISTGLVKDLGVTVRGPQDVPLIVKDPVDPTKCV
jgi:carbonic anhydrase